MPKYSARSLGRLALERNDAIKPHIEYFFSRMLSADYRDIRYSVQTDKITLFCSFCGTSQYKARKLVAGPTSFICDECTEESLKLVKGVHDTDVKIEVVKDQIRLTRSIHFTPEHRQAGIGILNYFSRYLEERYPKIETTITIEQDGNSVRLIVEAPDGSTDVLEQTLEEYALIVTGRAQPQEFLHDHYQIMELRQKLEMAAMEIRWQERYIKALEFDKTHQGDFFAKQIGHLNQSLALGLSSSTTLAQTIDQLASRPSIDPSTLEAIERIAITLRSSRGLDEAMLRENLSKISERDPSILREIYQMCRDTAHDAAGHILAMWIAPLLGILPR